MHFCCRVIYRHERTRAHTKHTHTYTSVHSSTLNLANFAQNIQFHLPHVRLHCIQFKQHIKRAHPCIQLSLSNTHSFAQSSIKSQNSMCNAMEGACKWHLLLASLVKLCHVCLLFFEKKKHTTSLSADK